MTGAAFLAVSSAEAKTESQRIEALVCIPVSVSSVQFARRYAASYQVWLQRLVQNPVSKQVYSLHVRWDQPESNAIWGPTVSRSAKVNAFEDPSRRAELITEFDYSAGQVSPMAPAVDRLADSAADFVSEELVAFAQMVTPSKRGVSLSLRGTF